MMKVPLIPTMEKEEYGKKRENHLSGQKEEEKELWFQNFSHLLEGYGSLTVCLILTYFWISTGP